MALPAVLPVPIDVWRGDKLTFPVRVWSDTAKTVPVDLTAFGSVFAAQIRTAPGAAADIPFTVDASDATTGQLVLRLTPAQTRTLVQATYGFDVQADDGTGDEVITLATGQITVGGDYTRASA